MIDAESGDMGWGCAGIGQHVQHSVHSSGCQDLARRRKGARRREFLVMCVDEGLWPLPALTAKQPRADLIAGSTAAVKRGKAASSTNWHRALLGFAHRRLGKTPVAGASPTRRAALGQALRAARSVGVAVVGARNAAPAFLMSPRQASCSKTHTGSSSNGT